MLQETLLEFDRLPRPGPERLGFVADLRQPEAISAEPGGVGQFARGICLPAEFADGAVVPETARGSFLRVAEGLGIACLPAGIPLHVGLDPALGQEELRLTVEADAVCLLGGDSCGVRRGLYLLEELLRAHRSAQPLTGNWQRRPWQKWRISRCFFSPTCRPPNYGDELTDAQDYYPDAYLDRLAHEQINALWITMYLRDLPSRFFPGHGQGMEGRLAKLRRVVAQCARYDIRCFVFLNEPRGFGGDSLALPPEEAELLPEAAGHRDPGRISFCTSSAAGQAYLRDGVDLLFSRIPELGGIINIMCLEGGNPCAWKLIYGHVAGPCNCPRCSASTPERIFADTARLMLEAMRRHNPQADMVGWFYFAYFLAGSPEEVHFLRIASSWPAEAYLMFNFEVGGRSLQLGKPRPVLDYSLSYIGPSELWQKVAERVARPAAKLQVSCSHEDASVPIIPVPGNLYRKYAAMRQTRCGLVMQCWYFGNYPGIMNRAAGRLACEPFPASEEEFLLELAAPEWGDDRAEVAQAWQDFALGYNEFPENLNFKWLGLLHHSVVFPWYLLPEDRPLPPSYIFSEVTLGGDRIGECLGYTHTLDEAVVLLERMDSAWQRGLRRLLPLRGRYGHVPARLADIGLAEAIGLQIRSARNTLCFYQCREALIFRQLPHLAQMRQLVLDEIGVTRRLAVLCAQDSRLGYHSEAEGYLFYPEKLEARAQLLEKLLEDDFPSFSADLPVVRRYRGLEPAEQHLCAAHPDRRRSYPLPGGNFSCWHQEQRLHMVISGCSDGAEIELEPARLYPVISFKADASGRKLGWGGMLDSGIWQVEKSGSGTLHFCIDCRCFAGIRPTPFTSMRFNLHLASGSLCRPQPWPRRLLMGRHQPAAMPHLQWEEPPESKPGKAR